MKKILALMLALMMVFALCACGDNASGTDEGDEESQTAEINYDKLYYQSGDTKFGIMDELSPVLTALGDPVGTFESESCAYQGSDYFYYYDGFELTANEIEGTMFITGITVSDDTVSIPQGVKIGMDIDEALSMMDVDYTQSGSVYKFVEGATVLLIRAGSDNTVAAIGYGTQANQEA